MPQAAFISHPWFSQSALSFFLLYLLDMLRQPNNQSTYNVPYLAVSPWFSGICVRQSPDHSFPGCLSHDLDSTVGKNGSTKKIHDHSFCVATSVAAATFEQRSFHERFVGLSKSRRPPGQFAFNKDVKPRMSPATCRQFKHFIGSKACERNAAGTKL